MQYFTFLLFFVFFTACKGNLEIQNVSLNDDLNNTIKKKPYTIPEACLENGSPPILESRRLTPQEVESSLLMIFKNDIDVYQFNGLNRSLSLTGFSTEPTANETSREAMLSLYELSESIAL